VSSAADGQKPLEVNSYAGWALLIGVLALVCFGAGPVLGTVAVVLGVLAKKQIARSGGRVGGAAMATAGMVAGGLSVVCFVGVVTLYVTLARPNRASFRALAATAPEAPSAALTPPDSDPAAPGPSDSAAPPSGSQAPSEPLPTTSTVTTIGNITVVDVAGGVASLSKELRDQRTAAASHDERLLIQTIANACAPCLGVASALGDPRMQQALDHVRLVRIDRDQFEEDLDELEIPSKPCPGFFLLDSDLKIRDAINGDEWDDDVAGNIAPVLGPFVRGTYTKRRSPWKRAPRPSGTVM
jgi:hypothetical protein